MPDVEFIYEDLQYQEALLNVLKNGCAADALILNMSLDGLYDSRTIIQSIRNIKKGINIVPLFKSTPTEDMQNWLETRGIHFVLIDNSFTIEDIYQSLKPERKLRIIKKTLQSNSGKALHQTEKDRSDESACISSIPHHGKNTKTGNDTHNAYHHCNQAEDAFRRKKGLLSWIYYSIIYGRNHCPEATSGIRRTQNTITIALFGSHPGAGCTHTAISVAWFLSRHINSRVALVELNGSGVYERLGRNIKHISEKCYELNGLHFYYGTPVSSLIKLRKYSYIIIDCGCLCRRDNTGEIRFISSDSKNALSSDKLSEIERADMRICVCQIKPWQADETFFLMGSELVHENTGDCLFYFTMTDKPTFTDVRKKFSGKKLYNAAYDPEIFGENPERDRVFQAMFAGLFPTGPEIPAILQ